MSEQGFLAMDVGSGRVRVGAFDANGRRFAFSALRSRRFARVPSSLSNRRPNGPVQPQRGRAARGHGAPRREVRRLFSTLRGHEALPFSYESLAVRRCESRF